jgi:tetratricopeptide (TPR) repeat protein
MLVVFLALMSGTTLTFAQVQPDTSRSTQDRTPTAFSKSAHDTAQVKRANELLQIAWKGDMTPWRDELNAIVENPKAHVEVLYVVAVQVRLIKTKNAGTPLFERILKIIDNHPATKKGALPDKVQMFRGVSLIALGKVDEGFAALDKIKPTERPAWDFDPCQVAHGVRNMSGVGEVKQYQGLLDRMAKRFPKCLDAILQAKADDYFARELVDEAVAILETILKSGKQRPELIDRIAGFYIRTKRPRKAVEMLRKLCNSGVCDARLRGNIVWAQSQYHREPQVIENTFTAAEAAPDDLLLQFEAGVMHHYARKYHLSQRFLSRAVKKWPDDPRILLYTAMNYYRAGQIDNAVTAIEHAVKTASSRDPDLYYCRGVIYRNKDLKVALENMSHYQKLMWNRKDSPFKKRGMVMAFIDGMRAELKRREGGAKPRYFADPEEDHFGEPPRSLGRSPDAIHTSLDVEEKLALLRKMRDAPEPPKLDQAASTKGAPTAPPPAAAPPKTTPPAVTPPDTAAEDDGSRVTVMIISVGAALSLALLLVFLRRRKQRSDPA